MVINPPFFWNKSFPWNNHHPPEHFKPKCIYSVFNVIMFVLSFKIPDVNERHPRDMVRRTLASNLVYTIWAVFGGFILHFLLSNYLSVLLRPSYEKPVDTAAEMLKRNITPLMMVGTEIYKQIFAASPDPIYQEISRRLVIVKDENCKDDTNHICIVRYFSFNNNLFTYISKSLEGMAHSALASFRKFKIFQTTQNNLWLNLFESWIFFYFEGFS